MPATQSRAPETFSLIEFIDALAAGGADAQHQRGQDELFASQLAAAAGGVDVKSRPGHTLPMARNMVAGTATAGGNIVGSSVLSVEAAARPQLVLDRLGAQRLDAPARADLSVPVWSGDLDATTAWIAEDGQAPSFTALSTRSVQMSAKCVATRVGYSRKVRLQSTIPIESAVLNEISRAVGTVLERGFLLGTGSEHQPLGLLSTPGLSTVTGFASALPTLAELASMVEAALAADAALLNCRWLLSTADFSALLNTQVVTNTGEMLLEFSDGIYRILGIPVEVSTFIPEGKLFVGDFTSARLAFFGAPQVVIDPFSNGKSINGATEIVLLTYTDFAVLHPSQIVLGSA